VDRISLLKEIARSLMPFDERDPDQVLALEALKDLFTEETTARLLAHDLFVHGRAVAEIRRTPACKIVGLDPLDATTIHRVGAHEYEQRIAGLDPIRIPAADLLVITREV
jgi:hypothetical protein